MTILYNVYNPIVVDIHIWGICDKECVDINLVRL